MIASSTTWSASAWSASSCRRPASRSTLTSCTPASSPTVFRTVCAQWPVPEVGGLDSYAAEGAAPILVVGTTNDPATPYRWAEQLADTLSSAVLLTYEGEGHTAYGSSNDCIADTVDAYLLTGAVPADGTRC